METRNATGTLSISQIVRGFIKANFLLGNESTPFTESDSFIQNGIMDSTGILELIEFLESTWEIKVEESETIPQNLDSLENVDAYVQRKLQSG